MGVASDGHMARQSYPRGYSHFLAPPATHATPPGCRTIAHGHLEALEDRCLPSYGLGGSYAVGTAGAIATVDLNGDGKLDLITAGSTNKAADVEVLLTK